MKKTRTGLVFLASATVACLALTGCSSNTPGGGSSSAAGSGFDEHGPISIAAGADDFIGEMVDKWNSTHADEQVTFIELPDGSDNQREQMIQNANTKSDAYTVLETDVVWTAEFAANRWIDALPEDKTDVANMIPATVETARYKGTLYAVPKETDGGLLYYRTDLLEAAGIKAPPTTFDEMKKDCDAILALPEASGMSCYAGQFEKYEGMTVNATELINAAGGAVLDGDKVTVDSPASLKAFTLLADWYADGTIPREAITYEEEQGRDAFSNGQIVFHRNWPFLYSELRAAEEAGTGVHFDVAQLPGFTGPGVSTLGGKNLAVSSFGKNKGTALDFITWFTGKDNQITHLEEAASAPTYADIYSDQAMITANPYLPVLSTSLETAQPRPQSPRYGDVTAAIQDAAYDAITAAQTPQAALTGLQSSLEKIMGS